jgi:drug/metabolite transporter (DMT)-like permease
VLLLTKLLLGARYRVLHYLGAAVCIGGLALLVVADDAGAQRSGDTNPLLGDVLVLIGALLYALGNVAQEHLLGKLSRQCTTFSAVARHAWALHMLAPFLQSIITAAACPAGHVSNAKLLALLGVFGTIFSLAQAGVLEHSALRDAPWNWQVS